MQISKQGVLVELIQGETSHSPEKHVVGKEVEHFQILTQVKYRHDLDPSTEICHSLYTFTC